MQHLTVERPPGRPWALLLIAKEPVNSMDTALWSALGAKLRELEGDASLRGLVVASGLARDVFTAGNDLKELYAPNTSAERYREFWLAQSSFLEALFRSRLATAAAIRGACPAGGTCVALCCDARFGTPNASLGLNEVALGIPVPKFWGALMARAIGPAPADRLLLGGAMVGAPEAARLGLLNGVAPSNSQGDVLALASAWVEAACKLPPAARAATKQSARAEFCAAWREYYTTEEPAYGWAAISDPAAVATMGRVMARLSGGGGGGGGKGGAAGASKL